MALAQMEAMEVLVVCSFSMGVSHSAQLKLLQLVVVPVKQKKTKTAAETAVQAPSSTEKTLA